MLYFKYIAITDSTDMDTTQIQVAGYELNAQNEELPELLEDEDIATDNIGMRNCYLPK